MVTHTYYFLRKFYEVKDLDEFAYSDIFTDYLLKFKQTFSKYIITDKLSFDLLNRSYEDNDEKKENEDIFYQLKYKQFINSMNEQSIKIKDRNNRIKRNF